MLPVELFILALIGDRWLRLFVMQEIENRLHVSTKHQLRRSPAIQNTTGSGSVDLEERLERFRDAFPLVDFAQRPLEGVHKSLRLAIGLWVIRRCPEMLNAVLPAQSRELFRRELRTIVEDYDVRNAKAGKQLIEELGHC